MPEYTQEQVDRWLGNLAAGMKRHGQTVFLIDQLQPDWLLRPWQRWVYLLGSRAVETSLFFYLLAALVPDITLEKPYTLVYKLLWIPLSLARYGLLLGLTVGLVNSLSLGSAGSRSGRTLIRLLLYFCASLLTFIAIGRTLLFSYGVIVLSAVFALSFHLRSTDQPLNEDIQTVQALVWSWKRALLGGGRSALLLAVALGPLIGLASALDTPQVWYFLATTVIATLTLFLLLWPLLGFFFGLQPGVLEVAAAPRHRLRLSLRNAVLAGTMSLVCISTIHWLVWFPYSRLVFLQPGSMALFVSMMAAVIALLRYGQLDVVRHYVLRLLLAATGVLPWRLSRFLGYAADELQLLQPAGSGCLFLHRLLFDYFAASATPDLDPELQW